LALFKISGLTIGKLFLSTFTPVLSTIIQMPTSLEDFGTGCPFMNASLAICHSH